MAARWAGVVMAAALLASCAPAAAPLQYDAPMVVSLNPCADAILAEIAPAHLAAISHYSHDPAGSSMPRAQAARFPAVSGSAEEVAAIAPDIVVAGSFLPPATERALDRMGFRVVKTGAIATVRDAIAQVRQLAQLTGEEAAGERLVQRIEESVRDAAPVRLQPPISALVWQSGGLVPGEDTLISDLLSRSGFANWSAGRGMGQGAILPLEEVIADPPPLILVAGNGGEENRKLRHPALDALTQTRRAELDPKLLFCGGPTIPVAMERLSEIRKDMTR